MAHAHAVLAVLEDLRAETAGLDGLVGPLDEEGWRTPTPAPGWDVARQIAHLAWTDARSAEAVTAPEEFTARAREVVGPGAAEGFVDAGAAAEADRPAAALLARWRAGRAVLWEALEAAPPGARFPWYGPPMGAASMATARLMETWAHGQDVADALGVVRAPTARLGHVARIGVRTRDFAFGLRGLTPPAQEFRVELTLPGGESWTHGPQDAQQRVTGPVLDFCLLVTQRRHRSDLALVAEGPEADRWLDVAQAFAGPPGRGRAPADGGTA